MAHSLAKIFRAPAFQITSVSSTSNRESGPSIKTSSRRGRHREHFAPTQCKRRPFVELNTLYEGPRDKRRVARQEITNGQTFKRGLFVDNDGEGEKPPAKKRKTS